MRKAVIIKDQIFKTKHIRVFQGAKVPLIKVVKLDGLVHGSKVKHPTLLASAEKIGGIFPLFHRKADDSTVSKDADLSRRGL